MTHASIGARHRVLALGFLVAAITYLDRACISAAAPAITADLGLSDIEMSFVFGVFALSYGLFEIPMGWLGDRIGQRPMLTRIVACWSVFTVLTGLAWDKVSLVVTRFLFGAAEAGAFPTLARALARWFPRRDHGSVNGVMWMGARLGGALAPALAVMLMGAVGWRATFAIFGLAGFAWCAVFWPWYRDDPAAHHQVSAAELEYIRQDGAPAATPRVAVPWGRMLRSGNLWALFWMYFTTSYGFWFFLTWLPTYLMREHGLSLEKSGFYAMLPLAAGAAASLAGGTLSDWLVRRTGSLVWGRRIVGIGGFLLAGAGFGAATLAHGPTAAVLCLTFSQAALDLMVPVAWATCVDVGERLGGTTTGFMNTASSISAMLSPTTGAWLAQRFGSFHAMFLVAMAVYAVGAVLWLRIDPSRKVFGRA